MNLRVLGRIARFANNKAGASGIFLPNQLESGRHMFEPFNQDVLQEIAEARLNGPLVARLAAPQEHELRVAFVTTKKGGLGLGLSISRTIIETHGGRLWATPNKDRGATFRFTLPTGGGG